MAKNQGQDLKKAEFREKNEKRSIIICTISLISAVILLEEQGRKTESKCKCQKSGCLKLYCDCLSSGRLCSIECGCIECSNNEANLQQRNNIIEKMLSRRPNLFSGMEIEGVEKNSSRLKTSANKIVKGCNCKRSNCEKKYCECFAKGIKCSASCICRGCQNDKQMTGSQSNSNLFILILEVY